MGKFGIYFGYGGWEGVLVSFDQRRARKGIWRVQFEIIDNHTKISFRSFLVVLRYFGSHFEHFF
jgi:hypothetical protein